MCQYFVHFLLFLQRLTTALHESVEEGECPYKSFYVRILIKEWSRHVGQSLGCLHSTLPRVIMPICHARWTENMADKWAESWQKLYSGYSTRTQLKPSCTSTEHDHKFEISELGSRRLVLYRVQLCGYRTANLCLCFRIYKKEIFS